MTRAGYASFDGHRDVGRARFAGSGGEREVRGVRGSRALRSPAHSGRFGGAASRKVETFEASIDADVFEAIARVWSLMLDRAWPDTGRPKFIVHSHVAYYFQDVVRQRGPITRRQIEDQLPARAAALAARLKGLKMCPADD